MKARQTKRRKRAFRHQVAMCGVPPYSVTQRISFSYLRIVCVAALPLAVHRVVWCLANRDACARRHLTEGTVERIERKEKKEEGSRSETLTEGICGSGGIAPPFLTSVLDGYEWSPSNPGRFTPREIALGTHWIGCVGPRACLDVVET
jgi:hypothetical protein